MYSLLIPSHSSFSISLSPSLVHSFSQWCICVFVSVHLMLLAWGVIHCLYLSLFTFSLFCLLPYLTSFFNKSGIGSRQKRPLFFLTHYSFLKSKPTEAKSGYYRSCVSSRLLSSVLPFKLKVYAILNLWEETKGSRSVRCKGAKWNWSTLHK